MSANPSAILHSHPTPFPDNLPARHRVGKVWKTIFQISTGFTVVILAILLLDIIDGAFGYTAIQARLQPSQLTTSGKPLEQLSHAELTSIIQERLTKNRIRTIENEKPLSARSQADLQEITIAEIIRPEVVETWGLIHSIFQKDAIFTEASAKYPDAVVQFTSWLDRDFLTSPQASAALYAGVRTAILGSLYVIWITIFAALPIGIGAAIYLQEYASNNFFNRLIQTNINNLAGVPSIIYGMLGLTIFVRLISNLTSGAMFNYPGVDPNNGRTILSAGFTLALLILPVIIINAQEAIKTVPNSLREASYGLGATRWQTVWSHVLPNSVPGIMTGAILAISRAFGETAPLVIVGASTYITFDPDSVFSKFTTLPIQIYQWTSRPQDEFRNIASAGIIVLMVILLVINAVAVVVRNRYSRTMQ